LSVQGRSGRRRKAYGIPVETHERNPLGFEGGGTLVKMAFKMRGKVHRPSLACPVRRSLALTSFARRRDVRSISAYSVLSFFEVCPSNWTRQMG
jgi:hypothetical protein